MPPEGEKIDELLSGYIDGALSQAEHEFVERAAQDDERISQRILQLRQQAADVARLGKALAHPADRRPTSLPWHSLADTVIARARQHATQHGLPSDHYLYGVRPASGAVHEPADRDSVRSVDLPTSGRPRRNAWIFGIAATAAALLALVVPWPQGEVPSATQVAQQPLDRPPVEIGAESPTEVPGSELQAPSQVLSQPSEQWVGQFGAMTYVLVADIQVTPAAIQNRSLEKIFAAAGIPHAEPLLADAKILKALDESRMIVDPNANSSQHIALTVIRASMRDIDTALQNIWKDERNFPKVGLNMAIDARAALTREILKSAAGRFSVNETFAVPLTTPSPTTRMAAANPETGSSDDVTYFSSVRRAAGWGQVDTGNVGSSDSRATILLVTHLVE